MTENKQTTDMKTLSKLVGTWKMSGDVTGQIEYTWAEDGFFLIQNVDLMYGKKKIKGIEMIGHLHRVDEEPSKEIWSRFYSFTDGLTLDYVYEVTGNTITIWFVKKGSNNFFKGTFSEDGNSFTGAWQWPGGGYSLIAKKVK